MHLTTLFLSMPGIYFLIFLFHSNHAFCTSNDKEKKRKNQLWLFPISAKSLQSCPTLCDPIDGSPPGSTVPGILQARTLEWVAISFSNAWKWNVKVKSLSCVQLLAIPWTAASQAPLSMGFSRQEYWSGVPLPSPSTSLVCPNFKLKILFTLNFRIRTKA